MLSVHSFNHYLTDAAPGSGVNASFPRALPVLRAATEELGFDSLQLAVGLGKMVEVESVLSCVHWEPSK